MKKKIPAWAWVALGALVLGAVVWYERRKSAAGELAALKEQSETGYQTAPMFDWGASPSGSNNGGGSGGDTPGTTPDVPPPNPELERIGYGYGPYFKGPFTYSQIMAENFSTTPTAYGIGTAATGEGTIAPRPVYTTPGQGPGMTVPA